jgi:hypothetical protein
VASIASPQSCVSRLQVLLSSTYPDIFSARVGYLFGHQNQTLTSLRTVFIFTSFQVVRDLESLVHFAATNIRQKFECTILKHVQSRLVKAQL